MEARFSDEEFTRVKNMLLVYEWGRKAFMTKLDIINEDFKYFHSNNPIEHIKSRIKSPESIAEKLCRLNLDQTADNAREFIKDIAGIRIICAFAKDIYYLADILRNLPDVKILSEKDYVSNPKPSGYRSFHIASEIPVYFSGKTEQVPVEVQIRTEAMDFWATLEHKVRYKYNEHIPPHLGDELCICAEKIAELDNRMFLIHDIISLINQA
jgi:putative GTP pyrophosphokinase